ncbi:uncharacterized protein LOC120111619 [Phoenix dactylifera]|uniref:Uncharacterized protein LOC120111619 n=1 Tax=Phoenix dactylifera TaxID=42345 RepID=A0A8B9AFV7_PHODC|nr:uncharacterized protein LOC120111619 [Phoenix dactylifera]
MEDCFQLRDEIEALIRREVLNQFVRNRREERRPVKNAVPPKNPNDNKPIAGTINVIGGGSSAKEPAKEGVPPKRPRTSEAISFSDKDLEGVKTPHDDAVVISVIENCLELTMQVGSGLSSYERECLIEFLQANMDVFAWSPADILGIDPEVMVHRLQVKPTCRPMRQKKRGSAPERQRAAAEEVDRLLEAGFIQEVSYPDWLANMVLVKKANRKWRICVDYTDLNKCAFGVISGKFLCFVVTQRGVEANPEKIRALQEIVPSRTIKEVQRLTGRVAALGRFVFRSAERCLPFFKILKRPKNFLWLEECQQAFEELRCLLASPPLLTKPQQGEVIYLYLAVSPVAVSSVLVRKEDKLQRPVYYTSRILRDAEIRYSKLEKIIFALITSARRLRPYFQADTVAILTDQPMKQILQRSDRARRIAKWAIELGEFDLEYRPRPAIKAQTLADFIMECTLSDDPELPLMPMGETPRPPWVLYVDGSSTSEGSGAGLILTSPNGVVAEQALRLEFPASNNEAEYEALIAELKLAKKLKAEDLKVFSDSQLIMSQILGDFEAKKPSMQKYLQKVRDLTSVLGSFNIHHIPRTENLRADQLSKLVTSRMSELSKATVLEYLQTPSTEEPEPTMCIDTEPSWMDEFINYLQDGILPDDELEVRRIKRQAPRYILYEGKLYRRSFTSPPLRCLRPSEADYAMREVHEGICGNHLGGRALAHKVLHQGYFWPTLQKDATGFVRRCDRCQRNANIQCRPSVPLISIITPWPFAQWGIDILGPFP